MHERIVHEDPTIDKLAVSMKSRYARRFGGTPRGSLAVPLRKTEKKISAKCRTASRISQRDPAAGSQGRRGPDNAQTLKKYAELEMLEKKQLSRSTLELMRPKALEEVVGQESAISSLLAKLSSPFPQHILLYGPPGVGKTTVARLALKYAQAKSYTPFGEDAPFIEVDGTTLRWDLGK